MMMRFDGHNLQTLQLLIFSGVSGSGKSTRIRELLECSEYQDVCYTKITGRPLSAPVSISTRLVIIDELITAKNFCLLLRLLWQGHTVIAASHLSACHHAFLKCFWTTRVVPVDRDPGTICSYLDQRHIQYSESTVQDFCRDFGASYVDLNIILEHFSPGDFDRAWMRYRRMARIQREPVLESR